MLKQIAENEKQNAITTLYAPYNFVDSSLSVFFVNEIYADRLLPVWNDFPEKLESTENKIHFKTKALFAHHPFFLYTSFAFSHYPFFISKQNNS